MRVLLLALALSLAQTMPARADALVERVAARLEGHPVIRAEFVQHKSIAALKRPVVTSGRLVFSREHGVLWRIERPYAIAYVLREDNVIEMTADGTRRKRSARDVPGLVQVNRVFRALLRADAAVLQEYFAVSARGDEARWELQLAPRQAQLAQTLRHVRVQGGRFIESIHLDEAGGDATRIEFRNTTVAHALVGDERALIMGDD